jgi:uncharacterized NAD(P)/FAD-binding protein YdhS
MIDTLMANTHANRINEMVEQIFAEIKGAAETMTGEHSQSTYSKGELMMMYSQAAAEHIQRLAYTQLTAERNSEAIMKELQKNPPKHE